MYRRGDWQIICDNLRGPPGRLGRIRLFARQHWTWDIKAFVYMGQTARLRINRDHFIAGHSSCELHRHLDSVSPETPIRDIVDRCRVWESHADLDVQRASKPGPDISDLCG